VNREAERLERIYRRYRQNKRKHRGWSASNAGNAAIRAELLAHIEDAAGDLLERGDLLDVGCGSGWLLREMARREIDERRLHGVELIESRIDAARRAVPRADVRHADARRLPYEADSIAVVAMLTVLSSLPDARAVQTALAEARRVLVPGGVLLVYEPRIPNPLNPTTRWITPAALDEALGIGWQDTPLTVFPGLASRLAALTPRTYLALARWRPLLTHRLAIYRESG
jgi:ubiquinone/menaquinone biosynthesis C-methylase UbiE